MGFMQAPAAGGSFNTYLKYDARAGRFYTKPEGGGEQYEVTAMVAVMDLEHIKTGWFTFMEGAAPVKVFDPSLSEAAGRPSPDAKRGFEVLMFSDKNIGGLREFASTAGVVIESMNALYDAWEAGKAANAGKLPVVKCAGVSPVKSAKSTNYQPKFEIVAWTDRPNELPVPEAGAPAPAKEAPKQAAQHVSAPPPPADAPDGDVDF